MFAPHVPLGPVGHLLPGSVISAAPSGGGFLFGHGHVIPESRSMAFRMIAQLSECLEQAVHRVQRHVIFLHYKALGMVSNGSPLGSQLWGVRPNGHLLCALVQSFLFRH